MRNIDEIIIHCSDSDIAAHDNIATIREWHKARNFKDVGYHYFVRKNGTVEIGRNINTIGAHCKGHNRRSIGVCLSGRSKFTQTQFDATNALIIRLYGKLGKAVKVSPHSDYSNKTCPNFDINKNLKICQRMNLDA